MFGSYALTFARGSRRHELLAKARSLGLAIADMPSLLCVTTPGTPLLRSDRGLLVGQLFARSDCGAVRAFPFDGFESRSALRNALGAFWGNFALFDCGPDGPTVYRDPSGSIGVYRCGSGEDAIFVSDAAIAQRLTVLPGRGWDPLFAAHWLQYPFLRTRRTGLSAVTELLPGMAWAGELAGWSESAWWQPARFLQGTVWIRDPAIAAESLRELASRVIPAQARAAPLVLQLSGGLDSSVIAACLARAGIRPECVNFATMSPDGDERRFARSAAAGSGLALTELHESAPAAIAPYGGSRFHPPTNPLLAPVERTISEAAAELGARALVDGGGGDNVFCSVMTASPVIDALRQAGLRTARETASAIALRAGCTCWDVFAAAARRLRSRRPAWKEDRTFLDRGACLDGPERHPWLDGLRSIPPGKREHVEAIVHIQHFLDRSLTGVPRLHPLMAQPLLELCLRIPSWLWVRGGRDRAVAREAFAGILPPLVLERRAKGSFQALFQRSFAALRPQMLEILMSGELRRKGLIDAAALEACLSGEAWRSDAMQMRVSELVALELWLQSVPPVGGGLARPS